MKTTLKKLKKQMNRMAGHHVGAYASQSAFFLVISLIPIILLFMTLIQYTPISKAELIEAVYEFFPKTIRGTIVVIVNQVYAQSLSVIPVTLLVAFWSAGRGVLAITNGLNAIRDKVETRNYIFLRIRAAFYTVLIILAIVIALVTLGFGNSISFLVQEYIPVFKNVTDFIIEIRTVASIFIFIVFTALLYKYLPNYKARLKYQLPGAIFAAFGWTVASFVFSVYLDVFKGFSTMYGSLTTIVLIMLWLYFCMYVLLLGGEINLFVEERIDIRK